MTDRRWFAHPLLPTSVLIGYLFSRLHNLLAFPMFLDEGLVLQWAHDTALGKILSFGMFGRVVPSWWLALFGAQIGTLFLGRAAHLLISLIGVAAAYALARRFGGIQAAWLTLLIVIFAPILFFFDRMLIPDAMGVGLIALTLWLLSDPALTVRGAIFAAISLTATIFTRATLIVLLVMPLLSVLLLFPTHGRRKWQWLTIVYSGTATLCLPLFALFYLHGQNYFFGFSVKGGNTLNSSLPAQILSNISIFLSAWKTYWGVPFGIILALGILSGLLIIGRKAWWLAGASFPLIAAICIAGSDVTVRYFLVGILPLIVIGTVGIVKLIDRIGAIANHRLANGLNLALLAGLVIWISTWAVPFQLTAYHNPAQLQLAVSDQQEYIMYEASGFGLRDAASSLRKRALGGPIHVIGWVSACTTLQNYLVGVSGITLECQKIHLTAQENAALITDIRKRILDPNPLLVISEDLLVLPDSALPNTRILLESFPRPDNGHAIRLWQLP